MLSGTSGGMQLPAGLAPPCRHLPSPPCVHQTQLSACVHVHVHSCACVHVRVQVCVHVCTVGASETFTCIMQLWNVLFIEVCRLYTVQCPLCMG